MPNFIVIYHSPASEWELRAEDQRTRADTEIRAWAAWVQAAGPRLREYGSLLGDAHSVTHSGTSRSTLNGTATAYSFLEAADMAEATALLRQHPHIADTPGATIEVYEVLPWPEASSAA